jgi:single-strand DNA-binding protein
MNKVILYGMLGQDPILRHTKNGNTLCSFTICTSHFVGGEKGYEREWHNCKAWGKTGENIQKLAVKGSKMLIEGMVRYTKFNKQDGTSARYADIFIKSFFITGEKKNKVEPVTPQESDDVEMFDERVGITDLEQSVLSEDDIPF